MEWLLDGSASPIKVEGSIGMSVANLTRCRVAAGIHYCVEKPTSRRFLPGSFDTIDVEFPSFGVISRFCRAGACSPTVDPGQSGVESGGRKLRLDFAALS
jgi:hypothetical protein